MDKKTFFTIILVLLIFTSSCDKFPSSSQNGNEKVNSSPTASITVAPLTGTTATTFTVDASECIDNEDATSVLEVRWDWENDGAWDTNYSKTKTATHQYSTPGTYTIILEVKDTEGLTNTDLKDVTVNIQYSGTVTDVEGNAYNTIQIGNQLWIADNFRTTKYRNGDAIRDTAGFTTWELFDEGAYLSYNNDDNLVSSYGRLYNWFAVNDKRGLAPDGWHIPSDNEWKELEEYLGMSKEEIDLVGSRDNNEVGIKLKSNSGWHENKNGTNESGFTALPSGFCGNYGDFDGDGFDAIFWSSTLSDDGIPWRRGLGYLALGMARYTNGKNYGFSVRCIKD